MRARAAAAGGAVALGLVALVPVAPAAGVAPRPAAASRARLLPPAGTRPVDAPGIDPVLDGVAVDDTAATRRASAHFDDVAAAQAEATLRWISADQAQVALAGRAARAGVDVDRATHDLAADRSTLDADRTVLARRLAAERIRRAALAVQQRVLRRLAAALVVSEPSDELAFLGDLHDYTASDRRGAIRDRSVDEQLARVEAARVPWARAHRARLAQERQVGADRRRVSTATRTRAVAIHVRDDFGTLLAAATAKTARLQGDLSRAQGATHDAAVARREARLTADVTGLDLPLVALDAYWVAAGEAPCTVPWWVIAGVGRVETRHGTAQGSRLLADGTTTVHILGIALDGRAGTQAVPDTDGGRLDDDPTWDRAVGPMQFLPGTWGRWATDRNGDGVADPHNIYDAAGAAAAYLCFGHGDLTTDAAQRAALLSYNRSVPYGNEVLDAGHRYRDALDLPDEPPADARSTPAAGIGTGTGG